MSKELHLQRNEAADWHYFEKQRPKKTRNKLKTSVKLVDPEMKNENISEE